MEKNTPTDPITEFVENNKPKRQNPINFLCHYVCLVAFMLSCWIDNFHGMVVSLLLAILFTVLDIKERL